MGSPSDGHRIPVLQFLFVLRLFEGLDFVFSAAVEEVEGCSGEEDAAKGDGDTSD